MSGLDQIAAERARQLAKGYDAAHDDREEKGGSLAWAASTLLVDALTSLDNDETLISPAVATQIPWLDPLMDKLGDQPLQRRLVVVGALIAAEIERLDRCSSTPAGSSTATDATGPADVGYGHGV